MILIQCFEDSHGHNMICCKGDKESFVEEMICILSLERYEKTETENGRIKYFTLKEYNDQKHKLR